jgi:integrase
MASVTRDARPGRDGWRVRFYVDGKRREFYVSGAGKKMERQASIIAQYCDELARAKSHNVPPAPESVAWANGTDGTLRDSLVAWGLADPISEKLVTDEGRLLGPFLDAYIASRSDVKRTTEINYKQTRRLLVEYFGASHPLRSITAADADRWRRWMLARPMAVATVSKHCKRAKTMLAEAVKDRLLKSSPFQALRGGKESNEARQFLVSEDASQAILGACPDADWRVIFSLARWGGMRCPSEVLALRWSDVDWEKGRLRIDSPKTGLRYCPLFPEIRDALRDAFDPEAVYCVNRYRSSEQNLRTQFGRILKVAGVSPWPKLFVNLRSTRRTELQERFPDHVVNRWMGHSGKVAEKHYLQVTDEHWERAASLSPILSPITDQSEGIDENHETEKPCEKQGSESERGIVIPYLVTPTGLELSQDSEGNEQGCGVCPPYCPPSLRKIPSDLIEVIDLWPALDKRARRDLIRMARALARSDRGGNEAGS